MASRIASSQQGKASKEEGTGKAKGVKGTGRHTDRHPFGRGAWLGSGKHARDVEGWMRTVIQGMACTHGTNNAD